MTRVSHTIESHFSRKVPPVLWHYTTLEAVKGIIEGGSIWASDARFLNDSGEYVHAMSLFKDVIQKWNTNAKETSKLNFIKTIIDNLLSIENMFVFVASFSSSKDQLSQWRGYGASTRGVALGLDLSTILPRHEKGIHVFAPCIYDPVRQMHFVEFWVQKFMFDLLHATDRMKGPQAEELSKAVELTVSESKETLSELEALMFRTLGIDGTLSAAQNIFDGCRLAALIKHHKFSEENEWRLVIAGPRSGTYQETMEVKARVGTSTFVPYVSVPLDSTLIPGKPTKSIKKVMMGPHPDPRRSSEAMKTYLSLMRLGEVPVECSQTPFRNW